jgi:hypothetical protein
MGKLKISSETSWKETKFGILPRSKVIHIESLQKVDMGDYQALQNIIAGALNTSLEKI